MAYSRGAGTEGQHLLVAGFFARGCREPCRHPAQRVEPVQREPGPDHELPEHVTAAQVDHFMRQHNRPPLGRPQRRRHGKQDHRPPQPARHGRGGPPAEDDPHVAADPQLLADRFHLPEPDWIVKRGCRATKSCEPNPAHHQRGQYGGAAHSPEQKWKGDGARRRHRLLHRDRRGSGIGQRRDGCGERDEPVCGTIDRGSLLGSAADGGDDRHLPRRAEEAEARQCEEKREGQRPKQMTDPRRPLAGKPCQGQRRRQQDRDPDEEFEHAQGVGCDQRVHHRPSSDARSISALMRARSFGVSLPSSS